MNDAIDGLHKNLGVYRSNLRAFLGPELCANWGIVEDDNLDAVREKVVERIFAAVRAHVDHDLQDIVLTRYNAAGAELRELMYDARMKRISDRLGAGFSRTNLKRRVDDQIRAVERALRGEDSAINAEIEQTTKARGELDETLLLMNQPNRMPNRVIRLFLGTDWLVPTAETTRFHLARPRGDDPWLCAFASLLRYDSYRRAAETGWRGQPLLLRGQDVVRELRQHCPTAGVLCDPPDADGGPVVRTLAIPASLVAQLANHG